MRWSVVPVAVLTVVLSGACSSPDPRPVPGPGASPPPAAVQSGDPTPGRRVTLEVGHCFVEPVRVAGREWVTVEPYVGHGGGLPRDFTDEGVLRVESATSAVFLADGGAEIAFEVAPDPRPVRACR